MLLLMKALLVPALVGGVTLASRRWGLRVGGVLTALPLLAGPTLIFYAIEQGNAFAADAGRGAMLGVAANASFCLAYAHMAAHRRWAASASVGIAAFAIVAGAIHRIDLRGLGELVIASVALIIAERLLPAADHPLTAATPARWDIPARMVAAATVVTLLTALARVMGSTVSGVLSAFPTVTLVLAAFTHAHHGHVAAASFLRGVIGGLHGFVLFCIVFSTTLSGLRWTLFASVTTALAVQLVFQAVTLRFRRVQAA